MDKTAEYKRFINAFMVHHASLPSGNLLTMLDLLARAQFMEGLAGIKFHTLSAKGSTSKSGLIKVIGLMMQKIDPMVNLTDNKWLGDGSSGLYKSAWLGANRIFAKTQGGTGANVPGIPLEATDLLNDNMLRSLSGPGPGDDPQEVINQEAIAEASAETGNFFWHAGRRFRPKAQAVVSGKITADDVGGAVALYANHAAISAVKKRNTEMSVSLKALKREMAPGEGEVGDWNFRSMSTSGWDLVVQTVLSDPHSDFAQDFLGWLVNDVLETSLTPNEQAVFRPYLDMAIDQTLPATDREYAKSIGKNPDYFSQVKTKFTDAAYKKFLKSPPDFLTDAANVLYLRALAEGRIRAASQGQGDRALRARIIRLAHQKPELRPHLLPLLKSASDEGPGAGRTWGNPDPRSKPDDNTPYNKHEDSPPAGADGSAQRKQYNKWFQDNVCPTHATNCGDPARFGK